MQNLKRSERRKKSILRKLFLMTSMILLSVECYANLPVFDMSNLVQNTITAEKTAAQVEEQIKQYQTQLDQYENMLQNSLAPPAYIWDKANTTISKLIDATNTLNYYKTHTGSLQQYLNHYQDLSFYRNSPCFNSNGCTDAQQKALNDTQLMGSEAQKKANDAVLLGIDQQQITLTEDSKNLARLQQQATGAKGQMEAIQAANQLASAQTNQLLQIRALLVAQQNAAATRAAVVNDKEAQQDASAALIRQGQFNEIPPKSW